jgi:hypothetical protein
MTDSDPEFALQDLNSFYRFRCDAGTTCAATMPLYQLQAYWPSCCGKPMRLEER